MNSQHLSQQLADFEVRSADIIKQLETDGANVWPAIKTSLFFDIIKSGTKVTSAPVNRPHQDKLSKAKSYLRAAARFLGAVFKLSTSRRDVLVLAKSIDKIRLDRQSQLWINQITDGLVGKQSRSKFYYIEEAGTGEKKEPSVIQTDWFLEDIKPVLTIILRQERKRFSEIPALEKLHTALEAFFPELAGYGFFAMANLNNIVLNFKAESRFFRYLLSAAKPKLVITAEAVGGGLCHAAQVLGIKLIDLQHGVIDATHPQYIYSGLLKALKSKMSLPSKIGVFGKIHRDVLLQGGFWQPEEVVVLGSLRVQNNRDALQLVNNQDSSSKTVLIPTQWNLFSSFATLLGHLGPILQKNTAKGVIKLHPLEPSQNIEEYKRIVATQQGVLEIAGPDADTYDLIRNSRIVIGFDSAVLLESVALKRPVITMATKELPHGILTYYGESDLSLAMRDIPLSDSQMLTTLLSNTFTDEHFYADWLDACEKVADYLYSNNFEENCQAFIAETVQ